nr:hypothetical protein [uncultured Desulfobacter sp.]
MVTSVGLTAPATCAAIRCGINNFQETHFMGRIGAWIAAGEIPLDSPWLGRARLVHMAVSAIDECLAPLRAQGKKDPIFSGIPLVICVSEKDRPGRFSRLEENFIAEKQVLRLCRSFLVWPRPHPV